MHKQLCPKCGGIYPVRHFRVWDEQKRNCRTCRNREAARKSSRNTRAKESLVERLRLGDKRLKVVRDTQVANKALRALKSRYMQFTAMNRLRIRKMMDTPHPKPRTLEALRIRIALQERCEEILAEQIRQLESGKMPQDIALLVHA